MRPAWAGMMICAALAMGMVRGAWAEEREGEAGESAREQAEEHAREAGQAARQEALAKAGVLRLPGASDVTARNQAFERREAASSAAVKWESTGPYGIGRVSNVEVDPSNDNVVYIGPGSGGVWKTTDGGTSWKQLFNNAKSQSIGAIAIAPSDHNIVWVGTGEGWGGGGSLTYPGAGLYKSLDGGATFTPAGLDSSFYIGRIAINPTNPNIVVVAVMGNFWQKGGYRGVYRTTNGGTTWEKLNVPLPAGDDSTGCTDIHIWPTDPNRMFANMWSAARQPYARSWGGPNSRVYRSDDGGNTWKILGTAEGLPTSDLGRNTMDISRSNPNIMYIFYLAGNNNYKSMYRSTNGGDTWTATGTSLDKSIFSFYAHSFGHVQINPKDPNDVLVSAIFTYRTTNGGASWTQCFLNNHVDSRAFSWAYNNTNIFYSGDDGGFSASTTGPNGTFAYKGQTPGGLEMSQIYMMDIAPDNSNYRYIGMQDNFVQMTANGGTSWQQVIDGDGMCVKVDYGAPTNVVGCWQTGNYLRSSSRGTGMVAVTGFTGRGAWDSPVDIDPINGMSYIASEFVQRATRGSGNYTKISPDLSNGDHSVSNYGYGTVTTLAALNGNVYAGTDDGNVWISRNASGAAPTWTRTRNGKGTGPSTGERSYDGWIKEITIDASVGDASQAYVAITYMRWGQKYWKPSAFKTTNFGLGGPGSADWTDISGDMPPNVSINKVIKDNAPTRLGWLYAATEYGVYVSVNGGVNWTWLGDKSLPIITVNDMVLHTATNYLYIGTYGRGIWRINLADPAVFLGGKVASSLPQSLESFPNPVVTTARIKFQVREAQDLQVALFDFRGRLVKSLWSGKASAGKPYAFTWSKNSGPGGTVPAGHYLLRAYGNKATMARELEVR